MSLNLNPDKALIFRITHVRNVRWMLKNGLHCLNAERQDPDFVSIGNPDLIESRSARAVDVPPYGTLADYVPFYFTPFSPMLYNIRTGYSGVTRRHNAEIVVLVSSLHRAKELGVSFVFSDRHAYSLAARFSTNLEDLANWIPWDLLQARDFQRDPEKPDKLERYQAEALIYRYLPVKACLGIVVYTDNIAMEIRQNLADLDLDLKVRVKQTWYFA